MAFSSARLRRTIRNEHYFYLFIYFFSRRSRWVRSTIRLDQLVSFVGFVPEAQCRIPHVWWLLARVRRSLVETFPILPIALFGISINVRARNVVKWQLQCDYIAVVVLVFGLIIAFETAFSCDRNDMKIEAISNAYCSFRTGYCLTVYFVYVLQ